MGVRALTDLCVRARPPSYVLRRLTLRSYTELIDFEDSLRSQKQYLAACAGACAAGRLQPRGAAGGVAHRLMARGCRVCAMLHRPARCPRERTAAAHGGAARGADAIRTQAPEERASPPLRAVQCSACNGAGGGGRAGVVGGGGGGGRQARGRRGRGRGKGQEEPVSARRGPARPEDGCVAGAGGATECAGAGRRA